MNFWTPRLEHWVKEYVGTCDACAMSKPDNQRPAGLLQPLPIPSQPWEVVSMDFIVKLPTTPRGHDSVMTVVDLLTKHVHFIPTREAIKRSRRLRTFSLTTSSDITACQKQLSRIETGNS